MKQWFIRTFRKRSAVRLLIYTDDQRLREYWAIPKTNVIIVKGVGAFTIDPKLAALSSKNVPTYIYGGLNTEPIQLQKDVVTPITAREYAIALEAKVAAEIFAAAETGLKMDTIIIVGAVLVMNAVGIYLISGKLAVIIESLTSIGIG